MKSGISFRSIKIIKLINLANQNSLLLNCLRAHDQTKTMKHQMFDLFVAQIIVLRSDLLQMLVKTKQTEDVFWFLAQKPSIYSENTLFSLKNHRIQ